VLAQRLLRHQGEFFAEYDNGVSAKKPRDPRASAQGSGKAGSATRVAKVERADAHGRGSCYTITYPTRGTPLLFPSSRSRGFFPLTWLIGKRLVMIGYWIRVGATMVVNMRHVTHISRPKREIPPTNQAATFGTRPLGQGAYGGGASTVINDVIMHFDTRPSGSNGTKTNGSRPSGGSFERPGS